ncbi:sigma-70 family RNA polymerase sigma factor [Lentisphaera profundi]|uniref:Sigma-70 family RNA polymerase sigma factor n=1 Tax=Lentisphaera profundi TaxID=1658616 RepID=A0ABY7VW89_9BACT|nr:sigma-70 family RNA polymerase sigma factor [Lentisphaera profundi]WDE98176.1 sigma-70 family RNA polymerase sigma factor [Lentisphaera profundi]
MKQTFRDDLLREVFRHHNALTAFAYSILRDWDLAQDAVQEAMITVNHKAESFEKDKAVLPWVKGIVRFKCLNIIRSRKKESFFQDEDLLNLIEQRVSQFVDEKFIQRRESQGRALKYCMAKLSESSLELLSASYQGHESSEDLASKYKRSVNSIYIMLSRIRQQLRKCTRSYENLPEVD